MKFIKILLLYTLFLIISACSTTPVINEIKDGIAIEKWPDGSLKGTGPVKNFKKNGKWVIYYQAESELILAEGSYINNLENGLWKYYHKNGLMYKEGHFKAGQKNGEWTEYYNTGKIKTNATYTIITDSDSKQAKGIEAIIGLKKTYYQSGKIWKEEEYHKGVKKGRSQEYYENGNTKEISWFEDNIPNGKLTTWWKNGKIKTVGFLDNGLKKGSWKNYYKTGKLMNSFTYKIGVKNGFSQEYYENGNIKSRGQYKADKKEGKWLFYNKSRKIDKYLSGYYKNGKK
jgi:antitoxin component YwqK of YwqJK toxin-antitoxin module